MSPRKFLPHYRAPLQRGHASSPSAMTAGEVRVRAPEKIVDLAGSDYEDIPGAPKERADESAESDLRLLEAKLFHIDRVAALGQLVSSVAHELNNPLTSILGYAQILVARLAGFKGERDARRILQEADRARRIAKNLLLFAHDTKIEYARVNLNDSVNHTLDLHRHQMRRNNIQFLLDLDPDLPATVADAAQLQQVLLNLLINAEQAIKWGNAAGQPGTRGQIRVRTYRVSADRIALEVADDGPGIAPEIAERIFDPFFRTKPPGVGTGLGLSIVRGIVREHGGDVSVQDRPGGGAVFTVQLPIAGPAASVAPGKARTGPARNRLRNTFAKKEKFARVGGRRERILVVEDEPTVASLIADVLRQEGHPVDTVLDSREALKSIDRHAYDLVICDLRMPHLDGRGFYRQLVRQRSPLAHRFVFVTGDTIAPRSIQFLETSGMPYLAKPFLVEELKETVHNAIAAATERENRGSAPER